METDTVQELRAWHVDSLRILGFSRLQREKLLQLMDDGEFELSEIRDLIEKRGWTAEQAFLSVA